MTHILLSFFFMINVVEYVTLILDWRHAEHTDTMLCSWYMFSSHVTLFSTTLTILAMVYFIYNPVESKQVVKVCLVCVLSVVVISVSVSSPTLISSHLDTGDTGACTLTLSSRPVINNTLLLLFNSVVPFWLPIVLLLLPLIRMMRMMNTLEDRDCEVNINFVIITSFIVFYTPSAALTFIRDCLNLGILSRTQHNAWILQVLQSLFLLFTYFFHIFRPLASFLLDPEVDLKRTQYHVPVYKI